MKTLKLINENTLDEYICYLPSNWNELKQNQLLLLVRLLQKEISAENIKLKMLLFCMKARVRKKNKDNSFGLKIKKKYFDVTTEELFAICGIFDFLFTTKDNNIQLNPLLVQNPFPILKIGCVKLHGPADGFTDYSYQDFMELQIKQSEIGDAETKIKGFISSMYKRKNGKPSKLFRFVADEKVTAILWFYLGCMSFFQERFPLVFSGSEASTNVPDGQMRIVDALAKNDVTKKKQVRESDLYEALYTMQIAAEENEKLRNHK